MQAAEIKKKVLAYKDWEWWTERPFDTFIMSLFPGGETREYMRKAGVDVVWPATLFQKGAFYKSNKSWDSFEKQLNRYLILGGSVRRVVKGCEKYGRDSKKKITILIRSKLSLQKKLEVLYKIITLDVSYVWLTHGFEHLYKKRLYKEAAKYIPADELDKFIGDVSYPSKKNAHSYLEQALKSNMPIKKVWQKYAWIKARDGFSEGFTIAELLKGRKDIRKSKHKVFKRPKVPKELRELVEIAQDLVYLRTLRTDILYELLWLARPILKEAAAYYKIPFSDMRYLSIQELIAGVPKKHSKNRTYISFNGSFAILDKPVLNDSYGKKKELKGLIANKGVVRGTVKIVKTAYEIGKVKKGDILFAPTTAPSYIIGMKKAVAFVTDEGGITSHAAIVSREMGKPCIIGTKIGTKVFKDGDFVELDANKGTVKIIKKH